jgi:hypothetical protein
MSINVAAASSTRPTVLQRSKSSNFLPSPVVARDSMFHSDEEMEDGSDADDIDPAGE